MIALVPIGASRRSDFIEPVFGASREMEQVDLAGIRIAHTAVFRCPRALFAALTNASLNNVSPDKTHEKNIKRNVDIILLPIANL